MRNKWQAAYEVAKYTNYDFFHHDTNPEIIWLKDQKKRVLLCLVDIDLTDTELEDVTDSIFNSQEHLNKLAGFTIKAINIYHLTDKKFTRKFKSKTLRVNHRAINNLEKIISNPFYKIDIKYKKSKADSYYQKRLTSRHPFEKYMIKFTPMTLLLVTLNTLIFLINIIFIHLFNSNELTQLLAVSHYEVTSGEYYRLLSSSFLHVGVSHFLMNIFALFILGKFVEGIYSGWHLLITYIISGVIASMFSLGFITEGISLGASGAVYGLLGVIIVHLLVNRKIKAKLIIQILVIFVVVSALSMLTANINHFAHAAGLIIGALLAVIYNIKKTGIKYSVGALIVIILFTLYSHYAMNQQTSIHPMDDEAMTYYEHGEYERALEVVNNSFNKEVETPLTYYILGELYIESGDVEKGQSLIDQSYEMDPSNELAAKDKIIAYRKAQDYDSMKEALDKLEKPIQDDGLKILAKEVN